MSDEQPEYPEPNWTTAPAHVLFFAIDPDGAGRWFFTEPSPTEKRWCASMGFKEDAGEYPLPLGCDWRLTLRQRPSQQ